MTMTTALKTFLLCVLLSVTLNVFASSSLWFTLSEDKKATLQVDLFLSSTCQYCHKAQAFFKNLESTLSWLKVKPYVINEDKQALIYFNQLLKQQNSTDFSVPSVFFCNSRWVGFSSSETTGQELLKALKYCKQQIEKNRSLTPSTVNVLTRWANAQLFDSGMIENPSPARYVLTMALLDALNPCALFVFISFLSLFLLQNERKQQISNGFYFVVVCGLVHYFQQAFSATFFEVLPWIRIPAIFAGLMIIYYIYSRKITHALSILTAFFLTCYQQSCVMNWSFIFEQRVLNLNLSRGLHLMYQLAYQVLYLLPLLVILVMLLVMDKKAWLHSFKTGGEIYSALFLIISAVILIIYPLALASLYLSLGITLVIIPLAWIIKSRITAK